MPKVQGYIRKMKTELGDEVQYRLPFFSDDAQLNQELELNALIGNEVSISASAGIVCIHCGRNTSKSFSQGYCYPCFKSLAQCDMCIMKPETCHYSQGTCREPEWADKFCMQQHYVYLSNASGLKIGITRQDQLPTRWIDQGAIQAVPILRVSNRHQSGLVEVAIAEAVKDKTNWRTMLKGQVDPIDMLAAKKAILSDYKDRIEEISEPFGNDSVEYLEDEVTEINYPVTQYPEKVKSYNLDKTPQFDDVLKGIKGQYLIFENGVINMRKYTAYELEFSY